MSDQPKIVRLLHLMKLLSGPKEYTIEEVAKILAVHPRSVERYCCSLEEAGFVLNHNGRYRHLVITAKNYADFDLNCTIIFSREEANLINLLISQLTSDVPLRHNLQTKLAAVCDNIPLTKLVGKNAALETVEVIAGAIRQQCQVWLRGYASAHNSQISDRLIEPVEFSENYTYVYAYDVERKAMRVFKLSRVCHAEATFTRWQNQMWHKHLSTDPFHMTGDLNEVVILYLTLRAYELLCEEFPMAQPMCEPLQDHSPYHYLCKVKVNSYQGVGRFILGLPGEVKVVESAGLVQYIKEQCQHYDFLK